MSINPTQTEIFRRALEEEIDIDLEADLGEVLLTNTDGETINPLENEKIPEPLVQDDGIVRISVTDEGDNVIVPAQDSTISDVVSNTQSIDDVISGSIDENVGSISEDTPDIIAEISQARAQELSDIAADTDNLNNILNQTEGIGDLLGDNLTPGATSVFEPVSTVETSTDEAVLETGGRPFVSVFYSVTTNTEIVFETSNDGSTFRELDRFNTDDEDTDNEAEEQFPWVGRRFFRVRFTDTTDGDIDISASR